MNPRLTKQFALALFSASLLLGIGAMFSHYWGNAPEGDTGCFAAIAHQLQQGGVLYQSTFDNKGPGIFYLHLVFQWITQLFPSDNLYLNSTSALQLYFFLLFYTCFAIFSFYQINKSNNQLIVSALLIIINLFTLNTLANWPAFFVGGYTEEIGSYLVFGAIFLLLTPFKKASLLSGLFFGFAILIKEPFILFTPILLPFFIKFNRQEKLQLILGMAFPWIFQAAYLTATQSWSDYFNYLSFASTYANGNPMPIVQRFSMGFENAQFLSRDKAIIFIVLILGVMTIKNTFKDQIKSLYLPVLPILIGFVFTLLGTQHYQHYNIAMELAIALAISFALPSLQTNIVKHNRHICISAMLLALLLIVNASQKQTHWQNPYPAFTKTDQETKSIQRWIEKLNKQPVYIDEQSSGRLYLYFHSTYKTTYPCPYYTYFLTQENPQNSSKIQAANQQIEQHQKNFAKEFKQHPPQYLLSLKNLSPAFWSNGLGNFVQANYQFTDSFKIAQNTLYVRSLK